LIVAEGYTDATDVPAVSFTGEAEMIFVAVTGGTCTKVRTGELKFIGCCIFSDDLAIILFR
jgi:hypothetical protein